MSGKFVEIALQRAQQTEYLKRRLVDAEAENQQLRDALERINETAGKAPLPQDTPTLRILTEIIQIAGAAVRVEER
jgi:hypothetical protein